MLFAREIVRAVLPKEFFEMRLAIEKSIHSGVLVAPQDGRADLAPEAAFVKRFPGGTDVFHWVDCFCTHVAFAVAVGQACSPKPSGVRQPLLLNPPRGLPDLPVCVG